MANEFSKEVESLKMAGYDSGSCYQKAAEVQLRSVEIDDASDRMAGWLRAYAVAMLHDERKAKAS